jgi:hypothetical protein
MNVMKYITHAIEDRYPAWEASTRQSEIRLTVMDYAAMAFALTSVATGPLLVWLLLWAAQ